MLTTGHHLDDATIRSRYEDLAHRGGLGQSFARRVIALAGEPAGGRVADIGCGTGQLLHELAAAWPTSDLVGVDFAASRLRTAAAMAPPATLVDADLGAVLPFPDATFDTIFCTEVLEHLKDPVRCLREIRRVLTPDGRLIVSVPNATGFAPFHRLAPLVPGAWLRGKLLPYEHPSNTDQPIDTSWTFGEIETLIAAGGLVVDARAGQAYFRYLEMLPLVRSVWRRVAPAAERMLPRLGGVRFAYHLLLRCRPADASSRGSRVCPLCSGVVLRPVRVSAESVLVRCTACRLVFRPAYDVDPPDAAPSECDPVLEERVAEHRTTHFERILRAAGTPGRLLDVGAGLGAFLRLAGEAGWQAVGVDVDPSVVAYARARGLDVRLGELTTLALPAQSFDVVTLCNVIDFVTDPTALLRECRRLLVPGGRIFIRTPNVPWQLQGARAAGLLDALGLVEGGVHWLAIFHRSNFSAHSLRIALARAGFEYIEVANSEPTPGDPYLGLGRAGETGLRLGKRVVFAAVEAAARVSGGQWLLGPSIEAWARKRA